MTGPIGSTESHRLTRLAGSGLLVLTGCAALPPNSFIDPTKVGMFPSAYQERGIRRALTPLDPPFGLVDAEEPTPEDLLPVFEEYRVGPMDNIQITILDLLPTGQPWGSVLEVSPTGYIRIPYLGPVRVGGMSAEEIERELKTRLKEANILPDPIVQVAVTLRRQKFFSAIGNVGTGGAYALVRPDTRLLDILGQIGDVGPLAENMYIIRREDRGSGAPPVPGQPPEPKPVAPDEEELIIPPPGEGAFETAFGDISVASDVVPSDRSGVVPIRVSGSWQSRPPDSEFDQAVRSEPAPTQPSATAPGVPEQGFRPLIFDPTTGELREAPAQRTEQPQTVTEPALPPPQPPTTEFDWEDVPEYELSQRVIQIDLRALKSGDPRYNLVLRNRDLIYVPVDTGVFYMMGEIARPGVFAFNGREITIKQAVAVSGGFTPLAWPQRCEIIRRTPGSNKQITIPVNVDAVFAGLEDDVLLRDGDIVNVGTHIAAPFLFVIRNSFRFTYGFGFVWDRNFADIEAFGARVNPETIRRARRSTLGLPF